VAKFNAFTGRTSILAGITCDNKHYRMLKIHQSLISKY
jgi:hypothetical protein